MTKSHCSLLASQCLPAFVSGMVLTIDTPLLLRFWYLFTNLSAYLPIVATTPVHVLAVESHD